MQGVFIIKKVPGLKLVVQTSAVYITSIVGAGFATGQEIQKFFTFFGVYGFYGIFLATVIFCAMGSSVLGKAYNENVGSLDDLLIPRVGNLPAKLIKLTIAVFQFIVFVIMQSGLKSLLEKAGLSKVLAYIIVIVILIFVISSGIKRVMLVNSILAPAIILGIVSLAVALVLLKGLGVLEPPQASSYYIYDTAILSGYNKAVLLGMPGRSWVLASILYVSFNTLLSLTALSDTGKILRFKSQATAGGVLGGALIGLMTLSSHLALFFYGGIVKGMDMPMVYLSFTLGNFMGIVYSSVIFFSMLCSASICGYSTVNRLALRLPFNRLLIAALLTIICIPLSSIKFASLIGFFYPAFGVAGLFVLLVLLLK